jgi:hypothetical protein
VTAKAVRLYRFPAESVNRTCAFFRVLAVFSDDEGNPTAINAELAEPAKKTGFVLRILRFLR